MAKVIQAIRGMNDCAPTESPLWQWVEGQVKQVLASYGYSEVRMPIVESTPMLFLKRCTLSGITMSN